ncbi:hypothetical protein ACCO45_011705 [Purpureocillium lilacinum]|uniref:Uncharacterized protein n=1 Tax=Purpureocillium lilacinum TaxID=33203 RepID=A0ACC4DBU5_PURLI
MATKLVHALLLASNLQRPLKKCAPVQLHRAVDAPTTVARLPPRTHDDAKSEAPSEPLMADGRCPGAAAYPPTGKHALGGGWNMGGLPSSDRRRRLQSLPYYKQASQRAWSDLHRPSPASHGAGSAPLTAELAEPLRHREIASN